MGLGFSGGSDLKLRVASLSVYLTSAAPFCFAVSGLGFGLRFRV